MTSDEPGMSVSAPATRPPVQDSAVATVSLRIRQRSSSERDRARASLPLMLVAPTLIRPWQPDGGARSGRNALLAARKAEPLAGRRLYRDARDVHAGNLGDLGPHRVAQRTDLRPLADHRHLEIGNAATARGDTIGRIFQEAVG